MEALVRATGYSAILFVALILLFLLREGLPAFGEVPLAGLLGTRWYPTESYFGLLPLIGGTLLVTIGATLMAVPLGLGTAIFIAESHESGLAYPSYAGLPMNTHQPIGLELHMIDVTPDALDIMGTVFGTGFTDEMCFFWAYYLDPI